MRGERRDLSETVEALLVQIEQLKGRVGNQEIEKESLRRELYDALKDKKKMGRLQENLDKEESYLEFLSKEVDNLRSNDGVLRDEKAQALAGIEALINKHVWYSNSPKKGPDGETFQDRLRRLDAMLQVETSRTLAPKSDPKLDA